MPKAQIVDKRFIFVEYGADKEKFAASKWLWEYLRDNDLIAKKIERWRNGISAEVIVRTEEKTF